MILPKFTLFSILCLALANGSIAQDAPGQSGPADPLQSMISVNFPGGNVQQYVDLLKRSNASNIVVSNQSTGDHALPSIQLNNVPLASAISLLEQVSGGQLGIHFEPAIAIVSRRQQVPQYSIEVLSVKHLVEDQGKEELLSAVELGINLLDQGSFGVEIKLHAETGLLFVKGDGHQRQVVQDIVSQMTQNYESQYDTRKMQMEIMRQQMQRRGRGGAKSDAEDKEK